MERLEIEKRVKEVISRLMGIKEDKIFNSEKLIEDLGANSLDLVELIMALEEKFAIEVPDEAWDDVNGTVQQVIDYIVERKGDYRVSDPRT